MMIEELQTPRPRDDRPSPPRRGGGGWTGKLALVFSLLALAISCAVLYLTVFHKEPEPEYITYRDQQLLVVEGLDKNTYDPEALPRTARAGSSMRKTASGPLWGLTSRSIRGKSTGRQWPAPASTLP